MYPKLTPPEFKLDNINERSMDIQYFSEREGLQPFVKGLLIGLGKMFNTPVSIEISKSDQCDDHFDIFKISW